MASSYGDLSYINCPVDSDIFVLLSLEFEKKGHTKKMGTLSLLEPFNVQLVFF